MKTGGKIKAKYTREHSTAEEERKRFQKLINTFIIKNLTST